MHVILFSPSASRYEIRQNNIGTKLQLSRKMKYLIIGADYSSLISILIFSVRTGMESN